MKHMLPGVVARIVAGLPAMAVVVLMVSSPLLQAGLAIKNPPK
jgi:hypothetical protein